MTVEGQHSSKGQGAERRGDGSWEEKRHEVDGTRIREEIDKIRFPGLMP
jgi:hypothetical protein